MLPAVSVALVQRPGTPDRLLQHLQPRRLQGRLADLVREPVQVLLLVAAPQQAQAQSVSDAAVESGRKLSMAGIAGFTYPLRKNHVRVALGPPGFLHLPVVLPHRGNHVLLAGQSGLPREDGGHPLGLQLQ